ncbi:MAG: site-2 protease family protein, partial [Clostridia bacterium]|nr:site-2 protease family protein [Clostridia bacterium]
MQINLLSFASVMNTVWAIFLAILILLIMITVHEFGHYIVGKIFHFKINEFSIGFGPALFKKTKKSGEVFAIRLIPLGGFCAFEGEEDDEENKSSHPDAFNNKPPWQR